MKKIISIMLVCMLITTNCFAATFTKTLNGTSINLDVDQGKTIIIRAKDILGKIFTGWTITGTTVTDPSACEQTITMGSEDITATANYATPYTITVEQKANGIISPSTVTVAEGSSQTFTITPNTGHEIEDVLVNGVSVLSSLVNGVEDEKTYTISNITGNKTITATYSSTGSTGDSIIPTISVSSKTTNSIKITTSAVDPSGGSLVYKLYVNGTLKATSAVTASGTNVSLTASGLNEYTSYGLSVTVESNSQVLGTSSTLVTNTMCGGYRGNSGFNCRFNGLAGQVLGRQSMSSYCYICGSSSINSTRNGLYYTHTCNNCGTVLSSGNSSYTWNLKAKKEKCTIHSSGYIYMGILITGDYSNGDEGVEVSCVLADHCIHGYTSSHD